MTVGFPRWPQTPARCRALPELVAWPVSRVCVCAVVWFCARSAAPPAALGVLSANSGSDGALALSGSAGAFSSGCSLFYQGASCVPPLESVCVCSQVFGIVQICCYGYSGITDCTGQLGRALNKVFGTECSSRLLI